MNHAWIVPCCLTKKHGIHDNPSIYHFSIWHPCKFLFTRSLQRVTSISFLLTILPLNQTFKVMRITEMITNWRSSWLLNKFSLRKMFFVLSQAWDKVKILIPQEELNLRPADSAHPCSATEPQRLYGERGLLRSSYC